MTSTKVSKPTRTGRTKLAKAIKLLSPAERFFYLNAGYSYDPKTETKEQGRVRCALAMAEAEAAAERLGWEPHWELDPYACMGCDCDSEDCDCAQGREHETYCAWITDENGTSLGALGSICSPTREYMRVVIAELASEALSEMRQADPFWDVPEPEEVL